jgi:transposase InsO family protein
VYLTHGLDSLYPKTRADLGMPRALSNESINRIHDIKQQFPYITGKAIYQKLVEEGFVKAKSTSLATVHRYIRENNLKTKQIAGNEVKSFEMEFANDCWQADTSHGPIINVDGKKQKAYLIAFIDDASRMLLHTQFYFNDNAVNMQDSFKKAVAKYGVPHKLFVDNGKSYDNLQLKYICASLGLLLIHARPYCGSSKGKVERVFRSIKDGWMHAIDWNKFSSLEELNDSLSQYLESNYINKIHSSIKTTPRERFLKDYEKIRFIANEELEHHFLHRKECRVNNTAVIKIQNKEYEVPQKYIGQKIKVRYLPFSMDKLYIFSDDNKIISTVYPVRKIDNSKIKRKTIDFIDLQEGE